MRLAAFKWLALSLALCPLLVGATETGAPSTVSQPPTEQANPVSPATSAAEIDFLLKTVEQSPCVFNRNGKNYPSEKATKHLRKKYNYGLRKYDHITAEQFIEHIASKSSWTGRPYTIQCGDDPVTPSAVWLTDQLSRYRAAAPEKAAPHPTPQSE